MIPKVNTASSAAEAMPSRDSGKSVAMTGEFEKILSSIEGSESKGSADAEKGVDRDDNRDRFEVRDEKNASSSDDVQSTEDVETSTEDVSEEDLYNTVIQIMQSLIAQIESQVGSRTAESEVDGMQENLDEKLQKLNELVSSMKGRTSGESLFDSSAFQTEKRRVNGESLVDKSALNTEMRRANGEQLRANGEQLVDKSALNTEMRQANGEQLVDKSALNTEMRRANGEQLVDKSALHTEKLRAIGESLVDTSALQTALSSGVDDKNAVLQQVLKETEVLKSFTDVDKKLLNDLSSILNRELGKKSDQVVLTEKVQSLVDPETIKVETEISNDNLSSKLRVDQLFHTLKSNVNHNGARSAEMRSAESLLAEKSMPVDETMLPNQLSPEKLENAKAALENILDSVRFGSLQSNVSNVGTGNPEIDAKNNRVMSSQILPRIETAIKAGESNFKMTLSPHGLGQVEVKLLLEGGNLKVQILASSSTTAELLAAQIDELKTALGTKDIQVTNSGHNQDFTDERNSEFDNEFFKQNEERKNRESDSSHNSDNKNKKPSDIGERLEAKLVNAKTREGNLLGRI